MGRLREARRQYLSFEQRLFDEIGLEPLAETRAILA